MYQIIGDIRFSPSNLWQTIKFLHILVSSSTAELLVLLCSGCRRRDTSQRTIFDSVAQICQIDSDGTNWSPGPKAHVKESGSCGDFLFPLNRRKSGGKIAIEGRAGKLQTADRKRIIEATWGHMGSYHLENENFTFFKFNVTKPQGWSSILVSSADTIASGRCLMDLTSHHQLERKVWPSLCPLLITGSPSVIARLIEGVERKLCWWMDLSLIVPSFRYKMYFRGIANTAQRQYLTQQYVEHL